MVIDVINSSNDIIEDFITFNEELNQSTLFGYSVFQRKYRETWFDDKGLYFI